MCLKKIVFFLVFLIIITASAGTTSPLSFVHQFESSELECLGQLIQLKYDSEKGEIKLDDCVLIEDDAPGNGPPEGVEDRAWFEKLHRGVLIKKEIVLDDPRAYKGYIVMNGVEIEQNNIEYLLYVLNDYEPKKDRTGKFKEFLHESIDKVIGKIDRFVPADGEELLCIYRHWLETGRDMS